MGEEHGREVPVTFAEGVRDDVASLIASLASNDEVGEAEVDALKRRIAQLIECEANPYIGEPMGARRHPELADCRRVRFDVPTHTGKPRYAHGQAAPSAHLPQRTIRRCAC
jgi:hypothetical protein